MTEGAAIREGKSSSLKGLGAGKIVIIIFVVLIVLMLILQVTSGYMKSDKKSDNTTTGNVEVLDPPNTSELIVEPDVGADPNMMEGIIEKHAETVEKDSGFRSAVVLPPVGGVDVKNEKTLAQELKEMGLDVPKIEPEPKQNEQKAEPKSRNKKQSDKKDVNPYTNRISDLYKKWDVKKEDSISVNLVIPQDVLASQQSPVNQETNTTDEYRDYMRSKGIDFLKVYPATLELGYNSDTGGLMILSVHHKGLKGVKFQATTSVGAYNERAAITLTTGVDEDGNVFSVQGVVVDQNDRIPSVKGKVDRHLLYNTIYGFGTSLLDAFAQYSELDAGVARGISIFPNTNSSEPQIDSDGLVVAQGASALSQSIREQGAFRPNTLTTEPWRTVGVVFLPR